jgi:hypothetical protein
MVIAHQRPVQPANQADGQNVAGGEMGKADIAHDEVEGGLARYRGQGFANQVAGNGQGDDA